MNWKNEAPSRRGQCVRKLVWGRFCPDPLCSALRAAFGGCALHAAAAAGYRDCPGAWSKERRMKL